MEGSILYGQVMEVFSEEMIFEQRPEWSDRMKQTDIFVSGKGKSKFLPRDRNKLSSSGTGRRQVWQEQSEGGKWGRDEVGEVGKGQIIQGLIGHGDDRDFYSKRKGRFRGF